MHEAFSAGAPGQVAAALKPLHPAQVADFLEALPAEERLRLWRLISYDVKGDILVEAHGEVRRQLIEESGPEELAVAVQRLDLDELSDIHEELPADVVEAVLRAMDDQRRQRFDVVRTYPENTAGGLMDVDAITVRPDVTLRMVLNYLARYRAEHHKIPAHTDAVMVVDLDGRYLGQLHLSDLISLDPERKVHDVMDRGVAAIAADTPAVRVARLFEDRDLVSAPVVDDREKLIGRITVDDVIDIIREEAEHSVMATAGLDEETDTFAPAVTSARRRAIWLGINLVSALLAAWVISLFDHAVDELVTLAILMPVVASMGGVAGTQSLALVIRGIALDHVKEGNRWRLLKKELAVGAINGLLWALAVSVIAGLWFKNPKLSLVFGAALTINLITGVASGTLIPMLLQRLRVDPVLAGGVILVALTDAFGFFVFLGMAAVFLV
ncbi:MAG: magnesium transporter [Betaproteobacteria bacterium SG8_41]|nr:MAG: magnesium transporter [Betaproteobacteria bacterium SG8_41]